MNKELLTIEFRTYGAISKTTTIGIFDNLEEAIKKGNEVITELARYFEVRADDKFKIRGLFGNPERLVTNCCYPTQGIEYFAKITKLEFTTIEETINDIVKRKNKYLLEQEEEENHNEE
jgi:hypothetical protein